MKEYRVVWTPTWDDRRREGASVPLPSLADAEAHRRYVERFGFTENVRIQVREWADLPAHEA